MKKSRIQTKLEILLIIIIINHRDTIINSVKINFNIKIRNL